MASRHRAQHLPDLAAPRGPRQRCCAVRRSSTQPWDWETGPGTECHSKAENRAIAELYRKSAGRVPGSADHARVGGDALSGNCGGHRPTPRNSYVTAVQGAQASRGVCRHSADGGGAMSCSRDLVEAYLDEELDATQRADVERHLAICRDCAEAYARLRTQKDDIRAFTPYFSAP